MNESTKLIDLFNKANKYNYVFEIFCKENFVIENYHFIMSVIDYKKTEKNNLINKYKYIIKLFFNENSIYQLNIDINLKNNIISINYINYDIFDNIYDEIFSLLKNDVYYRFMEKIKGNESKYKILNEIKNFSFRRYNSNNGTTKINNLKKYSSTNNIKNL